VRRIALPGLVLALAAGGCGGGETAYTPEETRACLAARGAQIGGKLDFVASTATGGAFLARLAGNSVKVVFGETETDARQIEMAYQHFAFQNVKEGLPDVLRRQGNVVMLWQRHPDETQLSLVVGCLS
jgi:hypothetical protein